MEWSVRYCLFRTQVAIDQILRNFPNTPVGLVLRGIVFPLGRRYRTPNDKLTRDCARLLLRPSEARDRLTDGVYVNTRPDDVTGAVEHALLATIAAEDAERTLRASGRRQPWNLERTAWLQSLVGEGVLSQTEATLLVDAENAMQRIIQVDDFPHDFAQGGQRSHTGQGASGDAPLQRTA